MRAFSIFVSALAFANLAQAAPLADTELAQLDADTFVEAELPLKKDTGMLLLEDLASANSPLSLAKNGAPVTGRDEKYYTWHNVASDSFEEESTEHTRHVTESTLKDADLKAWANKWAKQKQIYQSQNAHPRNFTDFDAWAAKVDGFIPKFKA